jgi:hypothetical protein
MTGAVIAALAFGGPLQDQRDRGQLTPQQFDAQRQQILDEI